MTIAGHVNSPVALSESPLFLRKFGSVYDAQVHGELSYELKCLFNDNQDVDCKAIGRYEVYGFSLILLALAAMPTFFVQFAVGILDEMRASLVSSTHRVIFLSLLASIGLILLPEYIVTILF